MARPWLEHPEIHSSRRESVDHAQNRPEPRWKLGNAMAEPGSGEDRQGDAGPVPEGDLLGGFAGAEAGGDAGPGDLAAECAKVRASEGWDAPGAFLEMRPIRMQWLPLWVVMCYVFTGMKSGLVLCPRVRVSGYRVRRRVLSLSTLRLVNPQPSTLIPKP